MSVLAKHHNEIFKHTVSRLVDELGKPGDCPSAYLPGKTPPEPNDMREFFLPRVPLRDVVQLSPELDRMTAKAKIYLQDACPAFVTDGTTCERFIRLPRPSCFKTMAHFKNTLCHEMGHWTCLHLRRRKNNYALEEVTAEITAAVLCDALDIKGDFGHSAYIAHFAQYNIDVLKEGVMNAAEASQYLLNLAEKKENT
jgi:hypothetical protein